MRLDLRFFGAGRPLAVRIRFMFRETPLEPELECDSSGFLQVDEPSLPHPAMALVLPTQAGFWSCAVLPVEHDMDIDCPPLPAGPGGWWHDALGLPLQEDAGTGMRIGVVDSAFLPDGLRGKVHCLPAPGVDSPSGSSDPLAHGAQVCSVLAAVPADPTGFAGICRGATVLHVPAVDHEGTPRAGLVASAIRLLAQNHGVDIINLSVGELPRPSVAIHNAILDAEAAGALVVAAAGNSGGPVLFPAAHPECVAVGAIGKRGSAPPHSAAGLEAASAEEFGDLDTFACRFSASGPELSAVAPGTGIVADINGRGPFDLSGTSFACPFAVGVLATVLGNDAHYRSLTRDSGRAGYARSRFAALCRDLNLPRRVQGRGLPRAVNWHGT